MLDHHLQRNIVYRLAFTDRLTFTQLKPDTIDNKLFTYHLKKVESAKLVTKDKDGQYTLTPEGRRLGIRALDNKQVLVDRPESVLFLVVRRKSDNAWLLYKRKTHPLRGLAGFMHCRPSALEPSTKTAARNLQETTGLTGSFKALGGGYFRVYRDDNLESFTHFTLLACEDVQGELTPTDEYAEYYWSGSPDFASQDMLPNMQILSTRYMSGKPFFVEEELRVSGS